MDISQLDMYIGVLKELTTTWVYIPLTSCFLSLGFVYLSSTSTFYFYLSLSGVLQSNYDGG